LHDIYQYLKEHSLSDIALIYAFPLPYQRYQLNFFTEPFSLTLSLKHVGSAVQAHLNSSKWKTIGDASYCQHLLSDFVWILKAIDHYWSCFEDLWPHFCCQDDYCQNYAANLLFMVDVTG
jgi:hypothetical protein